MCLIALALPLTGCFAGSFPTPPTQPADACRKRGQSRDSDDANVRLSHGANMACTQGDDAEKTDGFWTEFFLLRPDRPALKWILDELGPADILHLDVQTRDLFSRALEAIKIGRNASDVHALEVRTRCVVLPRYEGSTS